MKPWAIHLNKWDSCLCVNLINKSQQKITVSSASLPLSVWHFLRKTWWGNTAHLFTYEGALVISITNNDGCLLSKYLRWLAPGLVAGISAFHEPLSHKIKSIILTLTIYFTDGILGKANNLSSLSEYLQFL